jgi:hypothetical protein
VGLSPTNRRGNMEKDKDILEKAIERHAKDLDKKELEMVLRFIYSLKDFR